MSLTLIVETLKLVNSLVDSLKAKNYEKAQDEAEELLRRLTFEKLQRTKKPKKVGTASVMPPKKAKP